MSSDDSTCSLIGDSEADDEELSFFYPPREPSSAPIAHVESAPMDGIPLIDPEVAAVQICNDDGTHFGTRRRNFRQRKAIQKLPYSLDRIKHRQLLQGYDVSSFEAVSEEITIPARPTLITGSKQVGENVGNLAANEQRASQSYGSLQVDHGRSQSSESEGHQTSWSEDSIDSEKEADSAEDEQKIVFRGRKVDIEKGYRGILPRMAWEKAFYRTESSSKVRKRAVAEDRKGLAKRKVIPARASNQDQVLLEDLVVPDNRLEEIEAPTIEDHTNGFNEEYQKEILELEKMSAYYQNKYHEELSSDGPSDEHPDFISLEGQKMDSFNIKFHEDAAGDEVSIVAEKRDLSDETDGAIENDTGTIEAMLTRQIHSEKTKHPPLRSPKRYRYRRGESVHKRSKNFARSARPIKAARKFIRKFTQAPRENALELPSSRLDPSTGIDLTYDYETDIEKKPPVKKPKKNHFGVYPEQDSELNRAAKTFTTIIEGPSRNYAISALQKHDDPETTGTLESLNINDKSGVHHYFQAIDTLLMGKYTKPPDIVKFRISNKQYTLSRFEDTKICQGLTEVFDRIINTGITNAELINVSDAMTAFLLHLNQKSVYGPISNFHSKFRSKVNSSRINAKPIHFLQIAVCQFMLLEVTKYADASRTFRLEIEGEIINHIVSFFKLLSACQESILQLDLEYLHWAFDIIAVVVKILEGVELLWQRLENEKLPSRILKIVVDLFPTGKPRWSILEVDGDFESVSRGMDFVRYCTQKYQWHITDEVILLFDRVFKKRRYENFAEETQSFKRSKVMYPQTQCSQCEKTLFDDYLQLLRSFKLTTSLVERIVPMSEISLSDSLSVVINRLNLIIVLSETSALNSEKRLEELVKSVVQNKFLASKDINSLKLICESVLNAVLRLFEIHGTKKSFFKASSVVPMFKFIVMKHSEVEPAWTHFLERLDRCCEALNRYSSTFLRTLYPCFPLMCQKDGQQKQRVLFLDLYLTRLPILGASWVHTNLFQTVQGLVHDSGLWIDHYCTVGKFLIENNILTWWTFYMYNNVKNSPAFRLQFSYQIARLCDQQSFDLIKRSLFETAAESFFRDKSALFAHFVSKLIDREDESGKRFKLRSMVDVSSIRLEPFVSVLSKLSYSDLIFKLVSQVRLLYRDGEISVEVANRLTNIFNLKFVDQVKDNYDFLLLKRDLEISDRETDKSSFREAFKSFHDTLSQICFLERGLIQAANTDDELAEYLDKIKSLFTFSVISDPFYFVTSIIDAHLRGRRDCWHVKARIVALYLLLMNEVLVARFSQVSPNEFLDLCRLFRIVCERLPLAELKCHPSMGLYIQESIKFQVIVLKISQGFLEQESLIACSKSFLHGTKPKTLPKSTELSEKIHEFVSQLAGTHSPATPNFPEPDCETFRSFIEFTENRVP